MKITGGDIEIVKAFEQQRGHNTNLNSYRCLIGDCKRVELSRRKIVLHVAVEHGVTRYLGVKGDARSVTL